MERYIDKDFVIEHLKFLKEENVELTYDMLINEFIEILPTEDVVSIKEIINEIDELYYDFENLDGNLTTFKIDGETLHTDVGYAIVGIEFYKNILKKRIGKYFGARMKESE